MAQPQTIDTDAVPHGDKTRETGHRANTTTARLVEKVEAAREKVREQFQARVAQAQQRWNERIADLEKRAQSVVQQVQTTAQGVVERKNDAVHKVEGVVDGAVKTVEQVAHDVGAKMGPGSPVVAQFEHLLKMPADVREDLLTNLGIASQKQIAQLHEEVAGLSAEITAQFVAQTEILSQLLEGKRGDGHDSLLDEKGTLRLHPTKSRKKKGDTTAQA